MTISRIFSPYYPRGILLRCSYSWRTVVSSSYCLVFIALHLSPPWGSVMRAASHFVGRTRCFLAWNLVTNSASYAKRGNIFKLHIPPK